MAHDVIVIGGGISGLTAAHDLMRRGFDVRVLERQSQVGGNATTDRFDGFLMEQGPTTFNASFPAAVEQLSKLGLLDSAADLGPDVKRRYLRNNGRLTGISTHPMGFFKSNYLSLRGRASMMLEILRPRKKTDTEETIHAFACRRFGREFADKVIDPMAAGLFMGDAHHLSINGAFPKLAELEQKHGSITRGILHAKRGSEPGRHLYSWRTGIGTIPETLAANLGERVHTGVSITGLVKTPAGFDVQTNKGLQTCRTVVLAVPPHIVAALLKDIDPVGSLAASEISAPPINVAFLGYKREQVAHPLDGLGYLGTKDKDLIISGAQFASTMYAGRAPDGYVAISAYAGGVRNPELAQLPEAELLAQIHMELAGLLGIKGRPALTRLRRWSHGLPQYTIGHNARHDAFLATPERVQGLFLTGNYINGVSVANCMETANMVVERIQLLESPC